MFANNSSFKNGACKNEIIYLKNFLFLTNFLKVGKIEAKSILFKIILRRSFNNMNSLISYD